MKTIVCSIKDRAADTFGRPFFLPSIGVAVRSFTSEVNRMSEDNQMYQHPDDFDLYELGSFVDDVGRFELLDDPRLVTRGKDVKTS